MKDLKGRVAVVTGAGSGIGRAVAHRLAQERMRLVLVDHDRQALSRVASALQDEGHDLLALPVDVRRAEQMEALAQSARERFGAVHLLCNNAGVTCHTGQAVWELSVEAWELLLQTNFWGVLHGVRAFLPAMLESGEPGHVVNTASMAGLLAGSGAYGVTKHAVVSLSESLLFDLRGSRIGVSCLCPGLVATSIAAASHPQETPAQREYRERIDAYTRGRGIPPEVVAEALVEGVREGRFYLFPGRTEAEAEGIRSRQTCLLEGSDPVPPPLPSREPGS